MSNFSDSNRSNIFLDTIKGTIIGLIITMILILIFSIIMTYTKLSEELIPLFSSVIMILSISIGAIIISRKIEKRGWLCGGLVGVFYFIIFFLLSTIFFKDFNLGTYYLIKGLVAVVTGSIGGMIGINIK